ncbi:MAG: hypothetical protein GY908_02435 [Flavobacteriales bacterium]|nr:hypothetical protein [Flavobacteriales bacterium]
MQLSDQAKQYLLEASKWANFIAIVGFIAIGLLIIMSFSIGTILASLPEGSLGGLPPKFFSFFYLIAAGIYFIPVFFLFQFGQKVKQAIVEDNHNLMTFGLKKLRSHYKFIGILFIIFIALYFFLILFGAFSALFV